MKQGKVTIAAAILAIGLAGAAGAEAPVSLPPEVVAEQAAAAIPASPGKAARVAYVETVAPELVQLLAADGKTDVRAELPQAYPVLTPLTVGDPDRLTVIWREYIDMGMLPPLSPAVSAEILQRFWQASTITRLTWQERDGVHHGELLTATLPLADLARYIGISADAWQADFAAGEAPALREYLRMYPPTQEAWRARAERLSRLEAESRERAALRAWVEDLAETDSMITGAVQPMSDSVRIEVQAAEPPVRQTKPFPAYRAHFALLEVNERDEGLVLMPAIYIWQDSAHLYFALLVPDFTEGEALLAQVGYTQQDLTELQ
ncbi:MAG: hypothetical protein MR209_06525 [Veillonellaceae bacterium]|nr:hypothetical protein [Veillonellaceae bacterium]